MKNFNEAKEELKIIKSKNVTFNVTKTDEVIKQAETYAGIQCILALLEKLSKQLNLEIKDDDGNVISVEDYSDYVRDISIYEFFENSIK